MDLYRAVDSPGDTLEFLLRVSRDAGAAKRFFSKALNASHILIHCVVSVDKNAAYPKALKDLKEGGLFPLPANGDRASTSTPWSNKIIARIKRLVKPGLGYFSFAMPWQTLPGNEVMNMLRKGQLRGVNKGDILTQVAFITSLFGVAA